MKQHAVVRALTSIARSLDVLAHAKLMEIEKAHMNGLTASAARARLREKLGLPPFENIPIPERDDAWRER